MAKTKGRSDELFQALRAKGLRKRVAKTLSRLDLTPSGGSKKARDRASSALSDLRSAVDQLEERLTGESKRRSEAAEKAARSRKRNAKARSDRAKKAAATRTGSGSRSTGGRKRA